MIVYRASEDMDGLLLSAYTNIRNAGDLDRLLCKNAHSLTGFLSLFAAPTATFIEASDQLGTWFLGWASPSFDGAIFSQWVHPCMRRSKAFVKASLLSRQAVLQHVSTILGLTKQPALVAEHERIGYIEVGRIPHFWEEEDVIALVLTREGFAPVLKKYAKLLER